MEGYQQRGGEGRVGEKVQGLRSIIGRYKIDRGRKNTTVYFLYSSISYTTV